MYSIYNSRIMSEDPAAAAFRVAKANEAFLFINALKSEHLASQH